MDIADPAHEEKHKARHRHRSAPLRSVRPSFQLRRARIEASTNPAANSTIGYASISFPSAGSDVGVALFFCFGNTQ